MTETPVARLSQVGTAIDLQRALAALGLGVCGALLLAWALRLAAGGQTPPGPPVVWLCDRDAGRVWGLDVDGFLSREVRIARPLALVTAPGGDRLVLQALRQGSAAPCRLSRWTSAGECNEGLRLAEAHGLVVDGEGIAYTLAGAPERPELLGWTASGEVLPLGELPGALDLRAGPGGVWAVGQGEAWRVVPLPSDERGAASPVVGWPDEQLLAVEFDAHGSWWLTEAQGSRRLRRLDTDLGGRLELDAPERAFMLVPLGSGGAWCLSTDGTWRRVGATGLLGPVGSGLQRPVRAACPDGEGGFWAVSPGAAQRVDRTGRLRLAQGGFDVLVDVAPEPPRSSQPRPF